MRQLRLAAIGAGFFSQYHYEAWSRMPEIRLESIAVRRDLARARTLAAGLGGVPVYDDVARMLDEVAPDLVDIITPPEGRDSLVRLVAARGIAMIAQKPLARLRPGDGRGARAYLDRRPYFQKMPRFLIHETGIHLIDVFRFLLGEVTGVFARLRRLNPVIAGEDAGLVTFDFASGANDLFLGNRLADASTPCSGTSCTISSRARRWRTGAPPTCATCGSKRRSIAPMKRHAGSRFAQR